MRIDAEDLVIEGLDSAELERDSTTIPLERSAHHSYTGFTGPDLGSHARRVGDRARRPELP